MRNGHDQIGLNVVRINIEHQIWKNPEIERFLQPRAGCIHALAGVLGIHGADGSELLGVIAEDFRAVLRVIDFAQQAGMRDGNVIALEVVIYVNFPVAIDEVVAAFGKLQSLELEASRLLGNLAEVGGKWLSIGVEIHEDELAPSFAAKRHHAHGAAVEEFNSLDVRRSNQATVQCVGPAVVLAAQNILAAAAQGDGSRAMTANVAEGAERTFFVANDNDRFADEIGGEETFWVGDGPLHAIPFSARLAKCSDELPGAAENTRLLDFQNRGIGVETQGECLRALDLFVHVQV